MDAKEVRINSVIGQIVTKIDFVGATDCRGAAQRDFCRIHLQDGSFVVLRAVRGLPEPYVDIDVVEPETPPTWDQRNRSL